MFVVLAITTALGAFTNPAFAVRFLTSPALANSAVLDKGLVCVCKEGPCQPDEKGHDETLAIDMIRDSDKVCCKNRDEKASWTERLGRATFGTSWEEARSPTDCTPPIEPAVIAVPKPKPKPQPAAAVAKVGIPESKKAGRALWTCPVTEYTGQKQVGCSGQGWDCPYKTTVKGSKVKYTTAEATNRMKDQDVVVKQNYDNNDYSKQTNGRFRYCCVKDWCTYVGTKIQKACGDPMAYDICVDDGLTISDLKYRCPSGRQATDSQGLTRWGIYEDLWLPFGGNRNGTCCTVKCVHK